MAPIQGDFYTSSNMDFHYQQQRRMSGPVFNTMPSMKQPLCNGRRFSSQTTPMPNLHIPQHQTMFAHSTTPDSMINNFHSANYPTPQKQPVRQVLSAPIQQTQQNPLSMAMLQRRDSVPANCTQVESELARYKTELCRPFEETGNCRYGSKCQFAHGLRELRSLARHPKYKTSLCRTFHKTGLCSYGHRCNFIHDEAGFNTELPSSNPLEQRPATRPHLLPLGIGVNTINSTGESPASSLTSGSPTASPCFLNDDIFPSFSPSSCSGSEDDFLDSKLGFTSSFATDTWLSDFDRDLITNLNNLVLN